MNDFTKEELQMISMDLTTTVLKHGKENCSDEYLAMLKKVDRMIDNYCDCEVTECIGGWVYKCVKCGKKFGDETQ